MKSLLSLFGLALTVAVISSCGPASPTPPSTLTATLPALSVQPSPTPDSHSPLGGGTGLIAFSSPRDGVSTIFTISVETGDVRRLTESGSRLNQPTWSPDGRRLGYVRWSGSVEHDIWFMSGQESEHTRVTSILGSSDIEPSWSPDGTKIAFTSSRDSHLDSTGDEVFVMNVYVVDLETLRQVQLTDSVTWDTDPDWSPNGQQIAWQGVRNGNNEILVMASDGSEIVNLTRHKDSDANPAWSPDGSRIAFVSDRSGNEEIYVMDRDGSNVRQLTNNPERDKAPAWSPDGQWLAYQSEHQSNFDIYIMRGDGSRQARITRDLDFDGFPSWQPPVSGAALIGTEREIDRDSIPEFISFRTISWISEHAVPLLTRVPIGFTADLESLSPVIGSSRLVDLGGQGFGTDEDFTLRHRLIEFLIQVMGFNTIVLEIGREQALLLDRYVNQGEGDPGLAIDMIDDPRWRNPAFLDLVEWVRDRNLDPDRGSLIHIYGIASTDSWPPLDVVGDQIFSGSIAISESAFLYLNERDRAMDANTRWLIGQLGSNSKLILWANDFDLLQTTDPMPRGLAFALAAQPCLGELIGTLLGQQPFSIGLVVGRGMMTRVDPSGSLEPIPIDSSPAGSFEWMGAGTGLATFLIPDLRGSGNSMLDRHILGRAVLSNHPEIGFQQVNLSQAYDALIYVDEVRPTRPLTNFEGPENKVPVPTCAVRTSCIE
ncbi:MAG: hypothetical protein BMS9Abin28_1904 [Anaerolineae bacterium]|nr:MAG: hypothetical protein BMS9Abin28_1904 [Anaerolineae bacterium]